MSTGDIRPYIYADIKFLNNYKCTVQVKGLRYTLHTLILHIHNMYLAKG